MPLGSLAPLESDVESLNELIRFEPPERPPSMEHIMDYTQHRFSATWIKYMYGRFKNVSLTVLFPKG